MIGNNNILLKLKFDIKDKMWKHNNSHYYNINNIAIVILHV